MDNWKKIYKSGEQMSAWPWSHLVSIFCKHTRFSINNKKKKILELGFGSGANIPFFLKHECDYYGVERNEFIYKKIKLKYPKLKKKLVNCNFNNDFLKKIFFDVIFDRASISLNNFENIKKTIEIIYKKLKPGGLFIGIDWYSKKCSDFLKKRKGNYYFFKTGKFKNMSIFFSDKKNLLNFFKKFEIIYISEKIITDHISKSKLASWNVVCKKK